MCYCTATGNEKSYFIKTLFLRCSFSLGAYDLYLCLFENEIEDEELKYLDPFVKLDNTNAETILKTVSTKTKGKVDKFDDASFYQYEIARIFLEYGIKVSVNFKPVEFEYGSTAPMLIDIVLEINKIPVPVILTNSINEEDKHNLREYMAYFRSSAGIIVQTNDDSVTFFVFYNDKTTSFNVNFVRRDRNVYLTKSKDLDELVLGDYFA